MSLNTFVATLVGDVEVCETVADYVVRSMTDDNVIVAMPRYRPYMDLYPDQQTRDVSMWASHVDRVFTCEHISHCILLTVIPDMEPYRHVIHGISDVLFWVGGDEPEFDCLDVRGKSRAIVEVIRELVSRGV